MAWPRWPQHRRTSRCRGFSVSVSLRQAVSWAAGCSANASTSALRALGRVMSGKLKYQSKAHAGCRDSAMLRCPDVFAPRVFSQGRVSTHCPCGVRFSDHPVLQHADINHV